GLEPVAQQVITVEFYQRVHIEEPLDRRRGLHDKRSGSASCPDRSLAKPAWPAPREKFRSKPRRTSPTGAWTSREKARHRSHYNKMRAGNKSAGTQSPGRGPQSTCKSDHEKTRARR